MPYAKRRTEDVVHVVMTDHYIQRRRLARDLLSPLTEREERYRGEVATYYPPQPVELYAAVAQVKQGSNLKGGIPRLQRAIEREHPERPEPYFELAKAYLADTQIEKSFQFFQEALRRDARYWPALYEYGVAMAKNGRTEEALAMLRKAAEAQPAEAAPHNDLGLVYIQLRRPADATLAFRAAVRLDPDFAEAWNNLGAELSDRGDRAGAEDAFRNAIRAQPDFSRAHANLAGLSAAAGDLARALWHFQKAVAADPESAEGWNGLVDVYAMQQQFREAIGPYRTALKLKPDFAQVRLSLGGALAALGQVAEARFHLEHAARSRDSEIVRAARAELSRIAARKR